MSQTANPPAPTLAPGADTGLSSTDNITDLNAPTFVGVAAPNATINLYDTDGSLIGTGTAGSTGLYSIIPTMTFTNPPQTANGTATSFTAAATLDDGVHRITVTATAPGSSVSLASAPLIVTIDSQPPDAPTAPVLIAASDTGISALDGITSGTTITLTGMSEPGATVRLSDGTTALGSILAAADGSYSITTGTLAAGAHSFTVIATDVAGNASKPSGATAVTIDTTQPPAPAAPALAPGSDTGVLRTDGVTSDTTPVVTGTAEAGATVRLTDQDGTLLGRGVAGSDGSYAITSTTLLAGAHALTVTATDAAGNVSAASAPLIILIDTAQPTAISIPASVPAAAGSVTFTVTFNQAIFDRRGITPADFRLVTTGTAFGNIDHVTGASQTGQITVDGIGGDGTIQLVLAGDSEITDAAGNAFVLTSAGVHTVSGTEAGVLEAVSAGPSGVVGTGQDPSPSLSGRYVAFDSTFDSGTLSNVYVKNMQTGGLTRISAGTDGPANGDSSLPSLSGNGSVIAFVSTATNLVPGGTPAGQANVYVAALTPADPASGDSVTIDPGSIQLVSAGNDESGSGITITDAEGHFFPDSVVLSGDGSTVAFTSAAGLLPGVEAGEKNVYSFDVATSALTLITTGDGTAGLSGGNDSSIVTSISADGTEIAFQSTATNLGNPLPIIDAFHDTPLRSYVFDTATGKLTVLDGYGVFGAAPDSVGAYETYNPQLSADGTEVTYTVQFESNSQVIFQRNLVTGAVLQLTAGPGLGGFGEMDDEATLSANGSYVAYDQNDLGTIAAESPNQITVVQAASPTDVTQVSGGYQPVITANANAVAFSAPFGDGDAVYEASLGVTAGIDAVDGADDIGATSLAAIKALGNLAITGDTNAPVGSTIAVQIGQVPGTPGPVITGTVTTPGQWTVLVPADRLSADGEYLAAVTIAAAAGQSAQVARTFTIDTTPPLTPDAPKLDAGSDTGLAHDGSATDTDTPTVTGSAEAGSTVTLIDQGGLTPGLVLGTGIADRNGIYAVTSIALTQGKHDLAITATDDAGNVSAASAPLALTIDTIIPDAPQAPGIAPTPEDTSFTGSSFNDTSASGTSDGNTAVPNPSGDGLITRQTTPTLSGTALPGARVTLYDSDGVAVLGTATADAKGNYSITSSTLPDGPHKLTVTQTSHAGDVSPVSDALDLTVDTLPPLSPVITSVGGPMTANAEHTTQVDVNGTAEPGSTVFLHVDMDNIVSGTTTVDPEGDYTIDGVVAAGVHKLTVIATDAVSNASQPSAVTLVTVDAASVPSLSTPAGTTPLVGHVSDDEIFGATVFEDANGNGVLDTGEVASVSDDTGQYTLFGGSGPLIATGGKDIGSGLTLPGNLTAPAGSTAITPLTTLLDAYIAAGGTTGQGGNNPFLFDLGLSQLTDVTTLDPAAAAKAGSSFSAEAVSAGIIDAAVQITAVIAGAGGDPKTAFADVFDVYARRLIAETGASLSDPANISALLYAAAAEALPSVTLNAAAVQAAAAIIAAGENAVRATEKTAIDDAAGAIDAGGPNVQLEVTVAAGTFVRAIDAIETEEQGAAATALTQIVRDPGLAAATQAQFTGAALSASLQQLTALYYTAIQLAPGDDTGASAFDHVTTDDTPTFIGTTTPGATVTLVDNSNALGITGLAPTQVLGTAVADSSGRFAVTSSALPTNTLLGVDRFGLEAVVSGVNGSLAPVSGSAVPVTPLEFYIATEAGPNDQQSADIIDVTDAPGPGSDATHQRVMVKVAADFYGTINVYIDGGATPVGTAVTSAADNDGYLLIETSPLAPGSHLFTITQTLQGGTVVPGNNTRTFVVTADPMSQGVAYGNGAIAGATLEAYTSSQTGTAEAATTPTGQAGGYTFPTAAKAELLGGWDTVTDLRLGGNYLQAGEDSAPFVQLDAPAGAAVVTALTSLVADINGRGLNSGLGSESLAQAEAAILDGLGLSPDLDLLSLNPLAEAQAGDTAPFLTEARLLDTQAIVFDAAGLDILPLLAIDIFNNGSLDLDDPAALLSILTSVAVHVAQPLAQTLATRVAASNTDLDARAAAAPDNAALITGTLAEEEVAQDGEGRAIFDAALSDGPTVALQSVTQVYTGANLQALVAAKLGQSAQVAAFGPTAGTISSAPVIHYTLQFTQPVSGIGAGAFQLIEGSGLADAAISSVTSVPGSDGEAYDVAVSTGIGQGTLGIGFTGSGVLDAAGKPLTSGLFEPGQTYTAPFDGADAQGLAAGDFNGDGKLDLVEAETNGLPGDGLTVFLNNGDGTFTATGQITLAAQGARAVPAVGDFNGDGKLDIVTSIAGENDVAVLPGNGDGTFQAPVRTATGNDPEALAVGDLNGDGRADVVTLNEGDGTISVLLGQGDGTFLAAPSLVSGVILPNEGFASSIALADLNGDGKLDIVATDSVNNVVDIFLGNGDGTFAPEVSVPTAREPTGVAVGDINGDGITDIVTADTYNNQVSILLGNGDGTFQADRPIALSTFEPAVEGGNREPLGIVIADVNNDGKADLIINGLGSTLVLIGDGTDNFQLADEDDSPAQETVSSQALAVGDFNGDGRTDFATPGVTGVNAYGIDVHLNAPQTVLNATASPVFINRAALAQPVLTQIAGPGTLNVSGTSYTLDLGTVPQGQAAQVLQFALTNLLGEFSSDAFSGTFATASAPGFTVTGDTLPGPLQAGQSYDGLTIAADATTLGHHTQTITFAPRDQSDTATTFATVPGTDTEQATTASVDGADVAGELAALTLVVTDDVVPATDVALLGAPASVTFGNAHVGDVQSRALPIANTAGAGAPDLGVTATASGAASVSGAVVGLAAGETDSADVSVGLDTGTAGAVTGTVTLVPVSDPSGGSPVTLASVPVAVSGSVYRLAAPSVTVTAAQIVHVGDPGTVVLTVANTGTADGYTENLLATLAGATGGLTANTATTGEVAAGASDTASLSLSVSTAAAAVVSGTATLNLVSDGGTGAGGLDGLGQTNLGTQIVPVSVTVYNYAQAGLSIQGGSLQQGASAGTYVLNLGTTTAGSTPLMADLSLLNLADGPADTLGGNFTITGATGFTNTGFAAASGMAAGQTLDEGMIMLSAATAGSYSETIVLNPTDTPLGDPSTPQAAQTITVTGVVLASAGGTPSAPAVETLNSPSSIVFANAHVGAAEQQTVSISNTATPPANALDVTPSATGLAKATGAISLLQPAATDTTDIQVGLDTSSAGLVSGIVTLAGTSDDGLGNTAPLTGAPMVSVSGRVYRNATASIAPVVVNVHVGDPGTAKINVSNTAAADGYSESLIALFASESAGLSTLSMAPTGDITAGASTALDLSFSTATAGTLTGTATVALTSDGGAIDGLGTTALPDVTVPVTVNVTNYAQAGIATQGGTLLVGPTAGGYVLELGTTTEGAGSLSADLSLLNESGGPSDLLGGSFTVTGGSAFTNTGFGPAASLAAGGTADAGTISLSTATSGAFSETIVLTPTDTSAAGINMVRSTETITVNGTITPTGTAQGDVHLVMFDGLHYDLQGEGDYVLARSTVAGDSFSVQMRAGPLNHNPGTTYATRIAAQLGQDVITFNPAGTGQLEVDGAADSALGAVGTRQAFAGGTLDVLAPDRYALTWSTGEELDVTTQSDHLDVSITLPASDGSGSVEGLLGPNNGPEDEFQLPDGRVLPTPSSQAELLSVFANAWSVPATVSLLNGSLMGTPPLMQFLAPNGTTPLALVVKQDPGEILTGSLLSGSGSVVIEGTLRNLSLDKLIDFGRSDMIDFTDVSGPALSIDWTSEEHLQIAAGQQSGEVTFATPMAASTIQTRADGHGGTLVWFTS